jgi:hypothetical protein
MDIGKIVEIFWLFCGSFTSEASSSVTMFLKSILALAWDNLTSDSSCRVVIGKFESWLSRNFIKKSLMTSKADYESLVYLNYTGADIISNI